MFLKNTFPNKFFNHIYLNQNAKKKLKSQDNKTTLGRISKYYIHQMYVYWKFFLKFTYSHYTKHTQNYLVTYENDGEYYLLSEIKIYMQ